MQKTMHIHIHVFAYRYVQIHEFKHIQKQRQTHMHTYIHKRTNLSKSTRTYARESIPTNTYTNKLKHKLVCTDALINIHIHKHKHRHKHLHKHKHNHKHKNKQTHTQTHTQTQIQTHRIIHVNTNLYKTTDRIIYASPWITKRIKSHTDIHERAPPLSLSLTQTNLVVHQKRTTMPHQPRPSRTNAQQLLLRVVTSN